jgi:hypothetical protein
VRQLVGYLIEHMIIDFEGDLDLEKVRNLLQGDDSREGRTLLAKLVADGGVNDMLLTLADCLREYITQGVNEQVIAEQIRLYSES